VSGAQGNPGNSYIVPNGVVVTRNIGAQTHYQFDCYIPVNLLCDFYFGCNALGAGYMVRVDSRAGTNCGIITTTSWGNFTAGYMGSSGPVTSAAWHTVTVDIGPNLATLKIDGVQIYSGNLGGTVPSMGAFIGLESETGSCYFDNIQIGHSSTPAQQGVPWFNARTMFGADNTNNRDATAAIQNAINAAGATGYGGVVYIPYGYYKISAPLTTPANPVGITIQGDGSGATRLMVTAAFSGAAVISIAAGSRNSVNDLIVQFANGTWSNNPVADCILVAHSPDFHCDNVETVYQNGYGINIITDATSASTWGWIRGYHLTYGKGGINVQGLVGTNTAVYSYITDCIFDNPMSSPAINLQDTNVVVVDNAVVNGPQGACIVLSGVCGLVYIDNCILGPYAGASATAALIIQPTSGNNASDVYISNTFMNGGNYGAWITAGVRVSFVNCTFAWCQFHGVFINGSVGLGQISIVNCYFYNNARTAGAYYDLCYSGTGRFLVSACTFATGVNPGVAGAVTASCTFTTAAQTIVTGCMFAGGTAYGTRPTYSSGNNGDPLSNFSTVAVSTGLVLTPSSAGAIVPGSGGTIATVNVASARFNGAAVTGVIMAPGTIDGQEITIINEGTGSITFAASGSNVANGSANSVGAGTSCQYIWSTRTSLWYPAAPAVGSTVLYNITFPIAWANTANDSLWHAYGGTITFTVAGAGADISVVALMVGRIQISNTAVNAILQGAILLDGVAQTACPYGIMAQTSGGGASGNVGGTWAFLGLAPGVHTVQFAYWYNGTANAGQLSNGEVNVTVVQK
jgi:hypothetical protein